MEKKSSRMKRPGVVVDQLFHEIASNLPAGRLLLRAGRGDVVGQIVLYRRKGNRVLCEI